MQYLSATLVFLGLAGTIVSAGPDAAADVQGLSVPDATETRELGKKHGGHGGGYAAPRPIIIAAPQKKMPIVQPVGKKGGYGGYGMGGGYGGYGGYGRYLQEEEIISEASIEDSADERELGKKKHGGHGGGYGYGYQQPIIIAAPQKKMPIVQPVGKKGGFGGYGLGGGYGGYGGYGRYLQEEEIISEASIEDGADERELGKKKHGGHGGGYGYQQPIIIAAPQKKMPIVQPVGKKGGFGGYGLGGGYGGYGRYMQEDEIISEASIEDGADERELGKKKHGGHGGGYGYQQPIIIAAPQKKMPIVQPVGKKGGFGGYGMGGGYGGYGRYMQEDEIISEASTEDSADERELGKKHGGHGGGYGYRPTVIIAAPQKKMPIVQPVGKKGGFGGYGMGGGYGGYGRYLQEEDVVEAAADERSLKQQVHHKAPPQKIVRPITKKAPAPIKMAPMKAAPRPITKKAPRPITKKAPRPVTKTVRTITKKAPRPAPMKKQPVQQFTKQARPVYHQNHYGHHGF